MIDAKQIVQSWRSDPIDVWRRDRRRRDRLAQYAGQEPDPDHRLALGREAERLAAAIIRAMGYAVETTSHKASYDLLVAGVVRAEVKASLWIRDGSRGKYQANLSRSPDAADLVIVMLRNGSDHWFVIPAAALAGRRALSIRCYNPAAYSGKYSRYRDRWRGVGEALAAAGAVQVDFNFSE